MTPGRLLLFASASAGIIAVTILALGRSAPRPPPQADTPVAAGTSERPSPQGPAAASRPPQETAPLAVAASSNPAAPTARDIYYWLNAEGDPNRDNMLKRLLSDLIVRDPSALVRIVDSQPAGPARDTLLRVLAQSWAAIDFAGAIRWAATLTDPEERHAVFAAACSEVATSTPADAIDAWVAYSTDATDPVLENLLQVWASKDATAALEWARNRPEVGTRDRALARAAFAIAENDPASGARLVKEIKDSSAQTEATVSVLHQWAVRDFAGASAWAATFPSGPLAERAQTELAGVAQAAASPRP